jgi:hypothetical protein
MTLRVDTTTSPEMGQAPSRGFCEVDAGKNAKDNVPVFYKWKFKEKSP